MNIIYVKNKDNMLKEMVTTEKKYDIKIDEERITHPVTENWLWKAAALYPATIEVRV